MKNKLFIIILFISPLILHAQNVIPFQGITLDASGKALASKKIGIKISILKDNASGSVSYAESHTPTTDSNGLFQVNIGSGTALTNTFITIDWSTLNYFLKVEMDLNGGTNYILISTTQMGFVPFAFYAKNGGSGSTSTGSGVTIDVNGNTAAGGSVFSSITTGFANFAFSSNSLGKTTTGDRNVALGNWTLSNNTTGRYNTAVGSQTLTANTTGNLNTAIGMVSLEKNTEGFDNNALGFSSLHLNTTGSLNIAIGNYSLENNTTGSNSIAIGSTALFSNKTSDGNIAIGNSSLYSNTTGTSNNAFGSGALRNNSNGVENQAFGQGALFENTTGNNNLSMGSNSLRSNKISNANVAIGSVALNFHTIGDGNIAIGHYSMYQNVNSEKSVAIGANSLYNNKSGMNTALGNRTLYENVNGFYHTAVGDDAGSNTTGGSNNIFLGHNSQGSLPTVSNEITFGDSNIKAIRSAVTSITSLSDARDKKNIQDLNLGLNFIQTLKPRSFQWDKREWYAGNTSDGSKVAKTSTAGFIAQELDVSQQKFNADWLNLVYKSNPEKLEANYGNLIPVLVKSIQELLDEQTKLLKRIEQLESKIK